MADALRNRVLSDLVQPSTYSDVRSNLRARTLWKNAGHVLETSSKIFMAVSGVLSFASGFYKNMSLAFAAGTASTVSLAMVQLASYCFREGKQNLDDLNTTLETLKINPIPIPEDLEMPSGSSASS